MVLAVTRKCPHKQKYPLDLNSTTGESYGVHTTQYSCRLRNMYMHDSFSHSHISLTVCPGANQFIQTRHLYLVCCTSASFLRTSQAQPVVRTEYTIQCLERQRRQGPEAISPIPFKLPKIAHGISARWRHGGPSPKTLSQYDFGLKNAFGANPAV